MVSLRCKKFVSSELSKLDTRVVSIESGYIHLEKSLAASQLIQLNKSVSKLGMEILDQKQSKIITEVMVEIFKTIDSNNPNLNNKVLQKICKTANSEYETVSRLFSELKGINLPQYIDFQRIEKVKELLLYEDWTLIKISKNQHFKNSTQLSRLFKKVTGLTPSFYKQLRKVRIANVMNANTSILLSN